MENLYFSSAIPLNLKKLRLYEGFVQSYFFSRTLSQFLMMVIFIWAKTFGNSIQVQDISSNCELSLSCPTF